MPPRLTHEIRQAFLTFFEGKDHAIIPGASLVPENDPTVLFTTAGMHPLVPYLLGEPHPQGKRLVDAQLCVRTQDIDEVGDASHLTCFEMLGNWSLGDYFKEEAIAMSFEFLTKILELDPAKLAVSCFEGDSDAPKDEESAEAWEKIGIPRERIAFLPKKENWWGPAGLTGPCGPDTEMFYWIGKEKNPPQGSNPANDETNWLEIWNDVFMQYNKKEDGTFEPLAQQNVDTGMGLERVAQVMQSLEDPSVKSVYDTDAFKPIMDEIRKMQSSKLIRHERIVADHIRAATFIIAEGTPPSNVEQGYVVRKLIRRSVQSANSMGLKCEGEFCTSIAKAVIQTYGGYYQHLSKSSTKILEALKEEETKYQKLLDGFKEFDFAQFVSEVKPHQKKQLTAAKAFDIFTTYGPHKEYIVEEANRRDIQPEDDFDKKFNDLFEKFKEQSRKGAEQKFAGGLADHSDETTKLHTATHLLQAALRKALGDHIYQKGSNVTAERLRFDFPHDKKMTDEEKVEVEKLVNDAIQADLPVSFHVTTVEGAKKEGAIGVFDERYGKDVKVFTIGEGDNVFSKEICGGPHVARTHMIGKFKITKEESSSAGIRRIKATVSGGPEKIETAEES